MPYTFNLNISDAVGSTVGQIAKIFGCNVIGIVGSNEKLNYVKKNHNSIQERKKYQELIYKSLTTLTPVY